MAIWISTPDSDPVLRRGEALGRYGSAIPALTLCALNIAAAVYHTATNRPFPWGPMLALTLGFTVLGQLMVWVGMEFLRRSGGWRSGIVFFLWAGALFTTLTIGFTGVLPLMVVPWIAPVVATIAKARRKRAEEGTAA